MTRHLKVMSFDGGSTWSYIDDPPGGECDNDGSGDCYLHLWSHAAAAQSLNFNSERTYPGILIANGNEGYYFLFASILVSLISGSGCCVHFVYLLVCSGSHLRPLGFNTSSFISRDAGIHWELIKVM